MSGPRWVDRDGGHYCTAHAFAFPRGKVCRNCTSDPGPPITVTTGPKVDHDAIMAEAEVRNVALQAKTAAEPLLEGNDREVSTGMKCLDTYFKGMRLWREMRTERLQIESDERLLEHDRKIAGLRGHN